MLVCPSDHHIADTDAFVAAAERGAVLAREGWLVAFGIQADRPETGFGYIRRGAGVSAGGSELGFRIDRFVEKPDRLRAQAFLDDGGYDLALGVFVVLFLALLPALVWFRNLQKQDFDEAE